MGGSDSQAGEVLGAIASGVGRNRDGEFTAPESEPEEHPDSVALGAGLLDQIQAGDAEVRHSVCDQFNDILRPDEEKLDSGVPDAHGKGSVRLLEAEPGLPQQPQGRIAQTALVG